MKAQSFSTVTAGSKTPAARWKRLRGETEEENQEDVSPPTPTNNPARAIQQLRNQVDDEDMLEFNGGEDLAKTLYATPAPGRRERGREDEIVVDLMNTPAAKTAAGTTEELLMQLSASDTRLAAEDPRVSNNRSGVHSTRRTHNKHQ